MEESNKTLALLLVAAIVVSLGGTIVSLNKLGQLETMTGRAVAGTATLTVNATATLDVTDTTIVFGSGSLSAGNDTCTLSSNASAVSPAGCGTWTWTTGDRFVFDNVGSASITVTIQSNATAAQFIGGTSPGFKYYCADTEGDAGGEGYSLGSTWTDFSGSAGQGCVTGLKAEAVNDSEGMYVQATIGLGASGAKSATITFSATAS